MAPQDPTPEPLPDAAEYIAKIRARLDAMSPEERAALDAEVAEMCRQIDGEERLLRAVFGEELAQVRNPTGLLPVIDPKAAASASPWARNHASLYPRPFVVGPPHPNEEGRSED